MRLAAFLAVCCVFGCGPAAPASSPSAPGGSAASSPPSSALAAPGPAAAACTDDSACGTHRCNTAAGKCAFPCAGDVDCVTGATCAHGAVATCLVKH